MIFDIHDLSWTYEDGEWKRSLVDFLVLLSLNRQHAVIAQPNALLSWCEDYLPTHVDYFKTRLASAQFRSNSLTIRISPVGANEITSAPPWHVSAQAAHGLINRPLRLVLENDQSDKLFIEATIPAFSKWCSLGWISPAMGGGSAMQNDIVITASDQTAKWRTFYLFDSDRLHPSELSPGWSPPPGDSCQGHNFEVACVNLPIERWHRLERRSIENYLPENVLTPVNNLLSNTLFSASIGNMVHFYNFKKGLTGDGILPPNNKNVARAARSQGFWTALPPKDIDTLQSGFGSSISKEFGNVPGNFSWPADVLTEMYKLADALQDAI